jgi:D-3-phosphoglycerate dehydrogenase / 2-oxoglutarate reductase
MPTVVIAYDGFSGITVEEEVLAVTGAEVVHTGDLDSTSAREATREADALMVTTQAVDADLITGMERCRIIARVGTGLDAIDIEVATEQGIWVTSVPDYSIDEVSTHAITLLLVQARQLQAMLASVNRGAWWDPDRIGQVRRLEGQTLGILACGRIGQATARKAQGLGLKVIAHDPYQEPDALAKDGIRAVDRETLFRESDFITLHAPLNDETRHIVNAETLALMKPSAFLINTARGDLINEEDLLEAVRSRQIAGAALDVLSVEPPPPDHPLLHEERILVTPHAAWYSEEAKHDVRLKGAQEVARVLQNRPPRAPVNNPNGS